MVDEPTPEDHAKTAWEWYDSVVPFVLLIVPPFITSLAAGSDGALELWFAPAVVNSDGSVFGVALATFVLAAASAAVVFFMVRNPGLNPWAYFAAAALALIVANFLAIWLGLGGLDAVQEFMSLSGMHPYLRVIVAFLLAGFATYGIGGAILGIGAGAIAGWRFAVWSERASL